MLHSNDREVYAAFLRGLFEADGTVTAGIPTWIDDVDSILRRRPVAAARAGLPDHAQVRRQRSGLALAVLRLLNTSYHSRWLDEIGFIGDRKPARVVRSEGRQAARQDHIPVTRELVDRVAPENDRNSQGALMEFAPVRMITPARGRSCSSARAMPSSRTCSGSSTTPSRRPSSATRSSPTTCRFPTT